MCEYCGCQSLASIDELTREHDEVVRLISQLRPAHDNGDVARMATSPTRSPPCSTLTPASRSTACSPMAADFPEQIAALEAEHRRIESVLAEAADGVTPSDPTRPDRLMEAMAMLRNHILKEQDGVFPAALAGLGTEEWEAVEKVRVEAGSALPPPAA
ncbi:hemerythrin domain-containing protein [Streptomyces sp. NPDC050448]|uniref:hemerythrin domain-containing protein n=1 Tax=Streptomyces sp. NPDC050448 TaxID=3155404 RepID=UPI00343DEBF0